MKALRNHRFLLVSVFALALVAVYLFWAKPSLPTSDLEVQVETLWSIDTSMPAFHVAYSPDGRYIAYNDDKGEITLLNLRTLDPQEAKLPGYAFQFTSDGLLAVSSPKDICFYDIHSRTVENRVARSARCVFAVSPSADMIALVERDRVLVQEIGTGDIVGEFPRVHSHGPDFAAFSPCGQLIAYLDNGRISVWDMVTKKRLHSLRQGSTRSPEVCFSPDSKYLAAPRDMDGIRLWDMSTGKMSPVVIDWRDAGYASKVSFSPDGRIIASGGTARAERRNYFQRRWGRTYLRALGGAFRLSDARTGALLWHEQVSTHWEVGTLAFSPDGTMLAVTTVGPESRVMLWKVDVKEKSAE